MTTRKEHGVILRNNRAAVGRTRSGPPRSAKEIRAQDARQRQYLRDLWAARQAERDRPR
jgi:hypothetical protein